MTKTILAVLPALVALTAVPATAQRDHHGYHHGTVTVTMATTT